MRDTFFPFWGGGGAAPPPVVQGRFGSLGSPGLSRQVGRSSGGFASQLADLTTKVS